MGTNSALLLALALNVIAFFYLKAWLPVVNVVKAVRLSRQVNAFRVAGLLLLIFAGSLQAQTTKIDAAQLKKYQALAEQFRTRERDAQFKKTVAVQWSDGKTDLVQYSDGDDALVAKFRQADDTTGYAALDNALRYVWNNVGKLMALFALLAGVYLLRGKLERQDETYGDVLRREAAERWEEETDDDSIHNPFDSPEGMQPTTQYVPVRTRR